MRIYLYQECYQQETYYWWHIAKQKLVKDLIKRFIRKKNLKILDLGCGTGGVLSTLKSLGSIYGLDKTNHALTKAKSRGIKNLTRHNLDNVPLPFKKNQFDLVLTLDVLEHLRNPETTITDIKRILKPSGYLIITVPAYKYLFSYWDKMVGHKTRYSQKGVTRLVRKSGFKVKFSSYFHLIIFIPAVIVRLFKAKTAGKHTSDFIPVPKVLNNFLILISQIESKIIKLVPLPFGLSIILIAKNGKTK